MAKWSSYTTLHTPTRKASSQGVGGRGRRVKCAMATMNKNKKRSYKKYRVPGR